MANRFDDQEKRGSGIIDDVNTRKSSDSHTTQFIMERRKIEEYAQKHKNSSTTNKDSKSRINDKSDDEYDQMHKRIKAKNAEIDSKFKSDNEKELQNIEELQRRLAYLKTKRMEFEKKKNPSSSKEREESTFDKREDSNSSHGLAGTKVMQSYSNLNIQQIGSPPLTHKNRDGGPTELSWNEKHLRDKDVPASMKFTRTNNYMGSMDEEMFRTHPAPQHDLLDHKTSSKALIKKPPKVENTTPTAYIKSDSNWKAATRYPSLSNNPTSTKHETSAGTSNYGIPSSYKGINSVEIDLAHKKSYDANIKIPLDNYFKFSDSPTKHSHSGNTTTTAAAVSRSQQQSRTHQNYPHENNHKNESKNDNKPQPASQILAKKKESSGHSSTLKGGLSPTSSAIQTVLFEKFIESKLKQK
jgi:hypothetical protein